MGRYASTSDLLELKWLPIKEKREWALLKLVHKGIYDMNWPKYLRTDIHKPKRHLRSSDILHLEVPIINNTFQDNAASLFNCLPDRLKKTTDHRIFVTEARTLLMNRAKERLIS